jgi:DNA-binding transcriptional ArsR family regulator
MEVSLAEKKLDEFTRDEIFLADLAKSLSHPARIKILKILYLHVCAETLSISSLSPNRL